MFWLYAVFYVVIPAMCLYGMRYEYSPDGLKKESTLELRGTGMIIIILAHAVSNHVNNATFFFCSSAILGVSACFFVSGYGLYKSYISKGFYKRYLLKRFSKLLIPYAVLYTVLLLISFVSGNFPGVAYELQELLTLRLNGLLLWYLKIQLLMYVIFYISLRFANNRGIYGMFGLTIAYIIILMVFGVKEYWYNTCIFFAIGVLAAKYDAAVISFITKPLITVISGGGFVALFGVIFLWGRMGLNLLIDGVYMLAFNTLACGLFARFSGSKILSLFGKYSMEAYLIHLLLLDGDIFGVFSPEKAWTYIILLTLTFAFSVALGVLDYHMETWIKVVLKK